MYETFGQFTDYVLSLLIQYHLAAFENYIECVNIGEDSYGRELISLVMGESFSVVTEYQ